MADEMYLSEKDLYLFGEVIASFHTISDLDEMLATIFLKIKSIFDIEGASIPCMTLLIRSFIFFVP